LKIPVNTYQQLNTLSKTDAAYIAGLVDGEGTVALTRKHKNENPQLRVSISSTERQILEFVGQTLGVDKITNKSFSASSKPCQIRCKWAS
jgi:hypothetical protein